MNFSVYVIENDVRKFYIGQTADLPQRIDRHNGVLKNKKSSFTHKQKQGGWKIVYVENFATRKEALLREKQLKTAKGRQFLKNTIIML